MLHGHAQEHNIGQGFSLYYIAHAAYLELRGSYARADAVLQEGERRCAAAVLAQHLQALWFGCMGPLCVYWRSRLCCACRAPVRGRWVRNCLRALSLHMRPPCVLPAKQPLPRPGFKPACGHAGWRTPWTGCEVSTRSSSSAWCALRAGLAMPPARPSCSAARRASAALFASPMPACQAPTAGSGQAALWHCCTRKDCPSNCVSSLHQIPFNLAMDTAGAAPAAQNGGGGRPGPGRRGGASPCSRHAADAAGAQRPAARGGRQPYPGAPRRPGRRRRAAQAQGGQCWRWLR